MNITLDGQVNNLVVTGEVQAIHVERGAGPDSVEVLVGEPAEAGEPGERNVYMTLGESTKVMVGFLHPGRWHRAMPNPNYGFSTTAERLPDGRLKLNIVAYPHFRGSVYLLSQLNNSFLCTIKPYV